MQHTDKAIAEFEKAYMRDLAGSSAEDATVWLERGSDGEYRSYQARGAWWGWQASRRELVVDLPKINPAEWACTGDECMALQQGISIAGRAVRAAGVTVRG